MKFIKKAIAIDAWQVPPHGEAAPMPPQWMLDAISTREVDTAPDHKGVLVKVTGTWLKAYPGDWIIKGVQGELYPCPAAVFTNSYMSATRLNFGRALDAIMDGHCVTREDWNGKGMYVFLERGGNPAINSDFIGGVSAKLFDPIGRDCLARMPVLVMHNAQGHRIVGWTPSQTDMLAESWSIVEGAK